MDSALVNAAGTIQLVGLAVLLIIVIVLGARIAGSGARGFSSLLLEVGGLLVAIWLVARPNDALKMLMGFVGGISKPVLPS